MISHLRSLLGIAVGGEKTNKKTNHAKEFESCMLKGVMEWKCNPFPRVISGAITWIVFFHRLSPPLS